MPGLTAASCSRKLRKMKNRRRAADRCADWFEKPILSSVVTNNPTQYFFTGDIENVKSPRSKIKLAKIKFYFGARDRQEKNIPSSEAGGVEETCNRRGRVEPS